MNIVDKAKTTPPSGPRAEAKRTPPRAKNWKKFTLPALFVLLIAIPVTILLSQQTQDLRQRAAETTSTSGSPTADLNNTALGKICTAAKIDAFLVIDKSESMENKIGGKTKLAWAKQAANRFVDLMATEETNYIGLASFARHGGVGMDYTKANPSAGIKAKINDLKNESNNNGTCLECAMIEVNNRIAARKGNTENKQFVIILSDGNINYVRKPQGNDVDGPDFPKGKAQAKAKIVEAMNAGTYIYLVGIGTEDGDGQRYLKGIANEHPTTAKYVYGGQSDEGLTKIYEEIATTMGKVSVSGIVFDDKDENGQFTVPPDASMSGVLVSLTLASAATGSSALATVTTAADGKYKFDNLCAEKYRISQTLKPGYYQTLPEDPPGYYEIDVNKETEDITGKDFGNAKGEIAFNFSFALHGLGIAGDNVVLRPQPCQRVASGSGASEGCLSNETPKHPERNLVMEVLDDTDKVLASFSGKINYNSGEGIFNGNGKILSGVKKGIYTFRAYTPMFLKKKIAFTEEVKPGETYTLPLTDLTSSDVNNNNELSVIDYNLIAGCYTFANQQPRCNQVESDAVDTNDDGIVNEFDVNLFIRDLTARFGD